MSTSLLKDWFILMINDSKAVSLSHSSSWKSACVEVYSTASSWTVRAEVLLKDMGTFSTGKSYL